MADSRSQRIGWIGLGNMGAAMARNMQKHLSKESSSTFRVYNRTAPRMEPLVLLGALPCLSETEVVDGSEMIFISSSDDAAVESIVGQILDAEAVRGKIVVDTTTIHPDTSKRVAEKLQRVGAIFVTAPCFGATPVAEEGKLLMAVAGPMEAADRVSTLIKGVLAREVLRVGEEPEKATLLKTAGNFMIAGIMEIVAEAMVFAEKTGLGTDTMQKLIGANFGPLAFSDSQRMTEGVYMPGKDESPWSNLDLALKDVGHGLSSAEAAGVRLGVGEMIMQNLQRAKKYSAEHGDRAMDSSSLYGVVRIDAGLDFETDYVKKRDAGAADE